MGKSFKIYFEGGGGGTAHQIVKKEPIKDVSGLWIETTTKLWRFDYI